MNLKVVGTAFLTLALAACSSQPTARAPVPPVAQATAVAPSTTPAAAAPVALLPNANGQVPVLNRMLIQAGYKAANIKGAIYYCREEQVTGTSFKRKVCLNEAQLRDEERRIKAMQEQILRTQASPGCMGPTCEDP